MGKPSPSAPAQPDPAKTAAAQTASNKETAYWNAVLNNVNQVTPYGTLKYEQTGGGKQYNMDAYNKALDAYNKSTSQGSGGVSYDQWMAMPRQQQLLYTNADPTKKGSGTTMVLRQLLMRPDLQFGANSTGANTSAMPKLSDFLTGEAPPQFTSTISLSPEQKAIYDAQTKNQQSLLNMGSDQLSRINQAVSSPYSYSGLPESMTADQAAAAQANYENALYDRMNPQFSKDEEALRSRLINQGIGQGSEAYNNEMNKFNQAKNDARMQAILNGANYAGTLQNQALQRRNQSIEEYNAQRNAPLNEYIGLTSGVQVQNPTFSSTGYGGAQAGDYQSAVQNAYNNAMQQYNAKVAGNNATQQSLFGLGSSLLGASTGAGSFLGALGGLFASDKRMKENIKPAGQENGHNIYEFNYIGVPERKFVGVMAQEVEKTHPNAVLTMDDGFKAVNYDAIGVKMREVH